MPKQSHLALVVCASLVVAAAAEAGPVTLPVMLLDPGRVPARTMQSAQQQLARIFAAAEVEVEWIAPDDASRYKRVRIDVVLLTDAMARRLVQERGIPPTVLAVAADEGRRAYVFVDRVIHLAVQTGSDPGDVLGCIIAHEIGHLLMPEDGHADTGIMQPEYEMFERGGRWFTPSQAEKIRAYLRKQTGE